ncbi:MULTISPECIES: metallophosphoesterase [unclassified Streptomyces]|uniref:metallophosphoesterase n=1 Tax=unclassified Streptomyces TaxID=2593676 RepID=UPI000F4E1AC6|nr:MULTISPECIES: metallophosphoesterase [unclassified Streptomyces]MDH6452390.1 putative MPP superfamily phosphohydrolase/membrane protein implicated in regulation of membrane protease activity [Streptomyces sp. SAI-119]MDH6497054.1 putative MPP superfamily phosphohydrolase/membrane protein implicated in regulation of membrane protease activity [Streptomyces sp. SAI-149]
MVIVFALLALTVLVTANWYLWRRLFRDTTSGPGRTRRVGAVLIGGGWLLAIGALVAERTGAPFWLQRVLAWPGFLWLALSIYLLLAVVAGEVVRPLLRRFLERRDGRGQQAAAAVPQPERVPAGAPAEQHEAVSAPRKPGGPMSEEPGRGGPVSEEPGEPGPAALLAAPSRRLFVSRVVAGAAAAAAVGTVGYGTYGVLRGPGVKRVTVPLAKLPRAAHGYRIAVVSDIHLSPVLGRGFAQKVVDTINSTQPDLIAVVGDLVDGSVKDLGPAAAPLARLKARHGSFFVTGNHEYFSGAEQWVDEVRRLGLRPLENDRTELAWFDLAGVNDIAGESEGQGPDFAKALGDRDTARACVLLAHQPVQIHDAVDHGVDLQLSGHTHGGQLWPGNFLAEAANPTVAGLERYGDTQLYVSRGAGAWGPPTRVGAPSDITVIELASRQA